MLDYAETTSGSTTVPVVTASPSRGQESTTDERSSPCTPSYAIGPLDLKQLTTLPVQLSTGQACTLLLPAQLPPFLMNDPQFAEGYKAGYLFPEIEEEWSVPQMVNWTYRFMQRELLCEEAWEDFGLHLSAWVVGCTLGDLAGLAETERTFALIGVAHLSFLLSFLTVDSPYWPPVHLYRADYPHRVALRNYRARVRSYREQGKSFEEAQRLALAVSRQ